jgi:hypothetical protein
MRGRVRSQVGGEIGADHEGLVCLVGLEFELRALCLQSKHSTT